MFCCRLKRSSKRCLSSWTPLATNYDWVYLGPQNLMYTSFNKHSANIAAKYLGPVAATSGESSRWQKLIGYGQWPLIAEPARWCASFYWVEGLVMQATKDNRQWFRQIKLIVKPIVVHLLNYVYFESPCVMWFVTLFFVSAWLRL